jgi:ATP-dependent exoDNAse (exonuclease V) alpha subunit
MRPLNEKGEFGAKCKKEYVLDDKGEKIKLASGAFKSFKVDSTDWNNKENTEVWRNDWTNIYNRLLDENGITERIDHRSYERQGIEKIPSIHLGVACSQMEQKGIPTERGNINRQIAEDNKLLNATRARISRLMKWIKDEKITLVHFLNLMKKKVFYKS